MLPTTPISVAELAAGAADADLLDGDGTPCRPLLVVDLDLTPVPTAAELERAVRRAREGDRLLVGCSARTVPECSGALLDALDLTLVRAPRDRLCAVDAAGSPATVAVVDPAAEAAFLRGRAEEQPQAALVLRQLLRLSARLPVEQALDAESLAYSTLLGGSGFAGWLAARGPRPAPPRANGDLVLVRREEAVLRITLNRPERRNAHGAQLRDALAAAVEVALWDPSVREVVLDGDGPCFSSGGDLDEFGAATDLAAAHLIRTRAGAASRLHAVGGRLTARLHGHCVGAGIELPAFASRVVAAPDTRVRLPELAMGLIPGAGGTVSLPRRIGRPRTLFLVLDGRAVDAERALAWGLVDRVEE
ncbi:enoyl-CoA hydratase/isomerase family protein [Streptomyces sp. NBC_01275]|uniref:enoyl-CoA hydratase/isomerase family protein n=1 Tax=Streptomyces sp. NBC_01275 TaxID=2903807 RepID=UPI00225A8ED3|nr:enoyl-CoA hydratase/isomerase family protein [Streptomyces sp. NBC_01275]MCX4767812.1 enoyl-CoA hydratase/isomerase family protein [Streptomyces sp. NBC_01275]